MLERFKSKYIGDREFYKRYILLAVPMILQSAITNFVSLLDNIMVGQLGTEQMTGVAIINQLVFVFFLAVFGAVAGPGIYGAQFFGKRDHKGHMHTFRMRLWLILAITAIAILVFIFFGNGLISLYLNDTGNPEELELTRNYALSYKPAPLRSHTGLFYGDQGDRPDLRSDGGRSFWGGRKRSP